MGNLVYLRMHNKLQLPKKQTIYLKDIAEVSANESIQSNLENTLIYDIKPSDKNIVIVDVFRVIYLLNQHYSNLDLQPVGPNQTIIAISKVKKHPNLLFVSFIWILLFIGAGMAIMNFHADVSMQAVHQHLHYLFTGKETKFPLWIQIPYSFGLGLGMILFFNYLFKKRINEEPSPLEVEMYKYQQDLDQYIIRHENKVDAKDAHSSD